MGVGREGVDYSFCLLTKRLKGFQISSAWLISDSPRLNLCALRTGSVWWDGKGWAEASSLAAYRFLFLKIMAVLTELRSINAQQTQQLLRIQDSHPFATPLMQELFSSTDG